VKDYETAEEHVVTVLVRSSQKLLFLHHPLSRIAQIPQRDRFCLHWFAISNVFTPPRTLPSIHWCPRSVWWKCLFIFRFDLLWF